MYIYMYMYSVFQCLYIINFVLTKVYWERMRRRYIGLQGMRWVEKVENLPLPEEIKMVSFRAHMFQRLETPDVS
jgi:hypothetical protein